MKHSTRFPSIIIAALAILCGGLPSAFAQIRVACVGDSITAGYGLDWNTNYPVQLQAILGSGYSVGNYGLSGSTALKQSDLTYWNSPTHLQSQLFLPNIVVIMFGANDSKPWNWNATNFNSDYKALIAQYQDLPTHPQVYICYTPPAYLPSDFGTAFDPVFIANVTEPAIGVIATQAMVPLIDNNTPMINRPDLFPDGVHPTAAGAGIIARQVADAINGLAPTNITTAALTASTNSSLYGSPVSYTATVSSSSGTVTGAVIFAANNVPFSTNTLSGGVASVTNAFVPAGNSIVAAQYVSQGGFLGSTRSHYEVVTPLPVMISGGKVYDGTTNIAAANLSIANNLDGTNLTLSGSGWLGGEDVGSQALITTNLTPALVDWSWAGQNGWGLYAWFNTPPNFGNAMICVVATRNTTSNGFVNSVSFPDATNFTRVAQAVNPDGVTTEIWYNPSVRSTNHLLVVGLSNPDTNAVCIVAQYTNLAPSGALDQIAGAIGTGTAAVTGTTPTTTQANELWIGAIGYANTNSLTNILNDFTDVTGQSSQAPANNGVDQVTLHLLQKVAAATGAASSGGTIDASQKWAGAIATFKPASILGGLSLSGPAAGNYTFAGVSATATITPAPTSLTLFSSNNPSAYSSNVTFTATVDSSAGTPSGAVVFQINGAPFATNNLVNGGASASSSLLPMGTNVIVAQFAAQGNYQSSSDSLQQLVTIGAFDLSSSFDGSQLALTWPAGGLLLEAPTLNGPWTTNTMGANSCTITPTGSMKFFRVRMP